jgi:hypothetical protein
MPARHLEKREVRNLAALLIPIATGVTPVAIGRRHKGVIVMVATAILRIRRAATVRTCAHHK